MSTLLQTAINVEIVCKIYHNRVMKIDKKLGINEKYLLRLLELEKIADECEKYNIRHEYIKRILTTTSVL
mgnify:FL=1